MSSLAPIPPVTTSPLVATDLAARDVEIVCCNGCCPAFLRRTGQTPDIKKKSSTTIAPFNTKEKTTAVSQVRLTVPPPKPPEIT